MPHHQSRQQRPVGGNGFPPGAMMGPNFIPGGLMDRRPEGMMMPQGMPHPHAMQGWIPGPHQSFNSSNLNHTLGRAVFPDGRVHHVPMPKTFSYDSTSSAASQASLSPKYDYSSSKTSKLTQSSSFESSRHQAAVALLDQVRYRKAGPGYDEDPSVETERSRPLKKRKTVTPQQQQQQQQTSSYLQAAHVSPMSHMSNRTVAGAGGDMADEDPTHASRNRVVSSATASMASSDDEDVKDEERNKTTTMRGEGNSAAAEDAMQTPPQAASKTKKPATPPPMHVVIPHFPSVLHELLTESEYAGKVVQWLPHGKAWRIVRWEALRRQVLPQFFPQLREEEQSKQAGASNDSAGSIDAFLRHVTAWGFEEITDGRDAGAYSHLMFVKDDPQLCHEMTFTSASEISPDATTTTPLDIPAASEGKDSHSHLRVPSLATPSVDSSSRANTADGSSSTNTKQGEARHPPSPPGLGERRGWGTRHHPHDDTTFINYEPSVRTAAATVGSFRSRGMPPYSPIRIRSGRGGAGRTLAATPTNRPTDSKAPQRSGFPVSNRGRRPAALPRSRSIENAGAGETSLKMLQKEEEQEYPTATRTKMPEEEQGEIAAAAASPEAAAPEAAASTSESQPRTVLKRRLPLARDHSSTTKANDNQQDGNEIKPSLSNASSSSAETCSTSAETAAA